VINAVALKRLPKKSITLIKTGCLNT